MWWSRIYYFAHIGPSNFFFTVLQLLFNINVAMVIRKPYNQ